MIARIASFSPQTATLYDIVSDPADSQNVAAQHQGTVKKFSANLQAWVATLPKEYLKTRDKDQ